MHAHARRRATATLAGVAVILSLTSCGGGASDPVEAGGGADPGRAAEAEPAPAPAPTTTIAPEPEPADAPSPVEGLSADDLRRAVEAPATPEGASARRRGPVAEPVALDGRTVWRLTIPGAFRLQSAAVVVAVGGTDVGEGVVADDLASLVVVTADPGPLVAGAAVTYRWGTGEPVEAGALAVVR